jgi:Tfp pilus assembly protein PilN
MTDAPMIRVDLAAGVDRASDRSRERDPLWDGAPGGSSDGPGVTPARTSSAGGLRRWEGPVLVFATLLLLLTAGFGVILPAVHLQQERAALRDALEAQQNPVDDPGPVGEVRPVDEAGLGRGHEERREARHDSIVQANRRLAALETAPHAWPGLLVALSSVVPDHIRLTALEARSRDPMVFEVRGIADGPGQITALMAGLQRVPGLDEVDLISSAARRLEPVVDRAVVHEFRLEVRYTP